MSDLRHDDRRDCLHCLRPIVLRKSSATGKPTWFHDGGGTDCPQPPPTSAEPMELEVSDV